MGAGQTCANWNADALEWMLEAKPDVVITPATRDARVGLTEVTPPGYVAQWKALTDAGIPVVAVRDTPRHSFDPPACAKAKGVDAPECASPRLEMFSPAPPWTKAAGVPADVKFLDFTDYLCEDTTCPPVIGNIWVYRDFNHPTATYMRSLSPIVEEKVVAALGW
jgi:hypothetical protein